MSSLLRVQGQIGQRTLLLTTAALPLTGWALHIRTGITAAQLPGLLKFWHRGPPGPAEHTRK
ncbi:hypothetical protein [Streptomyces atratus]|uniref:hypothetical protein n=1 Tax=Streptomyces atratus TaxID=1893 RepID=UPI00340353E6